MEGDGAPWPRVGGATLTSMTLVRSGAIFTPGSGVVATRVASKRSRSEEKKNQFIFLPLMTLVNESSRSFVSDHQKTCP